MFERLLFVTCVLALALPSTADAQQYEINWHTIDGGGGKSTGGAYSLQGTIGQPDSDVVSLCSADGGQGCTNPTYELTGGFWVGIATAPVSGGGSCGSELNCIFRDGFDS